MAKLSSKGDYVMVEWGDTLSGIAVDFGGGYNKYKQLAAINDIPNPDKIAVGQKVYLSSSSRPSSSSSSSTNNNKPIIKQFGLQSNANGVLFATWDWDEKNTESYKAQWTFSTGDGIWFDGSNSTIKVDEDDPAISRQSTYSIPANAKKVRFKVKPISKKKTTNNKEVSYWEAKWSDTETYTHTPPPEAPPAPAVEIDKYKLTATLENLTVDATEIEFEVVKNNSAKAFNTGKAKIVNGYVSYSCTVDAGCEYKVRCRAYKGDDHSDWSPYSGNEGAMPAAPSGITTIKATSKTSVYLAWEGVASATSYDIEYTTKKSYFDSSNQTTTETGVEGTHFELTGLESGQEYFFRVRAARDGIEDKSAWCEPKSIRIGDKPAAPTTWSSTTTAIVGEALNLYWVHNAADGSSQTYAELELNIGGDILTYTIKNDRNEDEKDKTSVYPIATSEYSEGTKILWRVRTAGITLVYGEWSVQRTVDIYAPATLDLSVTDSTGNSADRMTAFPLHLYAVPGPNTQAPLSYHVAITSNEVYETVDNVGNPRIINRGEEIYSKHFDILTPLDIYLSAGDIDLENNVSYTLTCTVAMNSGLSVEVSRSFTVSWEDVAYTPNAEIGIDRDSYTAMIRPYCVRHNSEKRIVERNNGVFGVTEQIVGRVFGEMVPRVFTDSGEQVYFGVTEDGDEVYYCTVDSTEYVQDVLLSVYRREFDGGFTELATGLDNAKSTTIIDPHPSLDYARYRIVATTKSTGAVSFYDPPGHPVNGEAVIIQWDEEWSDFETNEEAALAQPPWSGSLLRLPYNVDISDSTQPDVTLVSFIGRSHPVAYYGTQKGVSSNWNMVIPSNDKETIYALRRLSNWMGNVYVREPSGSGYWANIRVSFSQKHCELTIPVTLNVSRVDGGA